MIDLMGQTPWTIQQIRKRCHQMIATKYTPEQQANVRTLLHGVATGAIEPTEVQLEEINDYTAFMQSIEATGLRAESDMVLINGVLAYEKARARLAKVRLSVGREEVQAVEEVVDEDTGETLVEAVAYVASIEPLPLQIESADEEGEPIMIDNPIVVQDELQRVAAYAVIDNASQAVIDLVVVRSR